MFQNKIELSKAAESTEWLSLDDYVADGQRNSVLYVRVRGESNAAHGIHGGDLVVVQREQKPISSDLVLFESGGNYSFTKFADVEIISQPLRLVARNGAAIQTKNEPVNIIGVVTHILKTISGK